MALLQHTPQLPHSVGGVPWGFNREPEFRAENRLPRLCTAPAAAAACAVARRRPGVCPAACLVIQYGGILLPAAGAIANFLTDVPEGTLQQVGRRARSSAADTTQLVYKMTAILAPYMHKRTSNIIRSHSRTRQSCRRRLLRSCRLASQVGRVVLHPKHWRLGVNLGRGGGCFGVHAMCVIDCGVVSGSYALMSALARREATSTWLSQRALAAQLEGLCSHLPEAVDLFVHIVQRLLGLNPARGMMWK